VELIVTKGGPGNLTDGSVLLVIKGAGPETFSGKTPDGAADLQLGKRYKSADGSTEVLVTKAGKCDLRYEGKPMELLQPRQLPSSD
jgi:hypothetical protein